MRGVGPGGEIRRGSTERPGLAMLRSRGPGITEPAAVADLLVTVVAPSTGGNTPKKVRLTRLSKKYCVEACLEH